MNENSSTVFERKKCNIEYLVIQLIQGEKFNATNRLKSELIALKLKGKLREDIPIEWALSMIDSVITVAKNCLNTGSFELEVVESLTLNCIYSMLINENRSD
ncbi:hypothetical protein [Spartinivicinus poritis]|uniref:Uncharacterized protein n=1 Tax=Spartinivicinus poritis TaxID=2994640 RepID=A0ABT5U4S3_9GAMM|nr:hypothetical protein [Spartinivicinus sp. A2-2]MDE1461358.1 hypothetical protein [Spartinivicinus sp. A2-2]